MWNEIDNKFSKVTVKSVSLIRPLQGARVHEWSGQRIQGQRGFEACDVTNHSTTSAVTGSRLCLARARPALTRGHHVARELPPVLRVFYKLLVERDNVFL